MTWKCPHCNKELEEKDAIRGNCPYCFQVFDRPEEFQEESGVPAGEHRSKFRIVIPDTESARLWLSLTALCFLLVSLFLEIWRPAKRYRAAPQIKTETAAPAPGPALSKKENTEVKSIRAKEQEVARTILLEYGRKTRQKIDEALKQERLLEQKDEANLGNLLGNPIGLAHAQLKFIYTTYDQAYLLLLDTGQNMCGLKITTSDITVGDTGFVEERLAIQPVAPSSLDAENLRLFNAVHSEPYEFLVSYTRAGNEWKVKEWTMVGTEWNFRPLPR